MVLLSYCFLSRAMRLSQDEYDAIPPAVIRDASFILKESYYNSFGETGGTYNAHIVCSHLPTIREQGPFTKYNAYQFESSYGQMRQCFAPGTRKF